MAPSSSRTPPQPPPTFDLTPESLLTEAESIIQRTKALEDRLVSELTTENATFANLIVPIMADELHYSARTRILTLFASVSPDQALRDASREAQKRLSKSYSVTLSRRDLALLVGATYERFHRGEEVLDDEDAHVLGKMYGQFRRNGLALETDDEKERFLKLKEELQEVLSAAKKDLTEADGGVWFTREDLEGVPDRLLNKLEQQTNDGGVEVFRVTFKQGHMMTVLRNAIQGRTRKAVYLGKTNQFPDNVERLKAAVKLRHEVARMLKYEHHAALKMEDKMSESVEDVLALLNDLKSRLQPVLESEITTMLELKRRDLKERPGGVDSGDDGSEMYFWDWPFYNQKLKHESYSVDLTKIAEYFEVDHTLKGMLSVFETLFGLSFRRADECHAWHEDVLLYTVWNSEDLGGDFRGYLYVDLFSRDGKYSGAHHISLVPGVLHSTETVGRRHQVSALVCDFNRPSADHPTLLQHSEVKSLFHELGHAIHYLVAETRYALGFSRDFVEIPSVMLENWIWVPDVLVRLGRHYSLLDEGYARHLREDQEKNGGDPVAEPEPTLPRSLAEDLARSRMVNGAKDMLHQVQLALFDLTIHTRLAEERGDLDFTKLWNEGMEGTLKLKGLVNKMTGEALGLGQAGFGHIFRGYDAGYFAYSLARICAADLYDSAFAENPMDPSTARRYRRNFLEYGARRPEADTLREFLGRKPSSVAYLRELLRSAHGGTGVRL